MKELTIEEKAKAYDKAIKKLRTMRDAWNNLETDYSPKDVVHDIEYYFPELKESDGEKIRKALIEGFKVMKDRSYVGCTFSNYNIPVTDIIAWLEKQGVPKEINPSEFDSQLNRLLGQFKSLPKEELASSLSFYLNVVQNDGTYKEEKQGEQKSAEWSEVDKRNINELLYLVEANYLSLEEPHDRLINFLESLKDRFLPQPKQEWSEEDETIINRILAICSDFVKLYKVSPASTKVVQKDVDEIEAWLKTLRPQSQWKPSDEQMNNK